MQGRGVPLTPHVGSKPSLSATAPPGLVVLLREQGDEIVIFGE